MSPLSMHLTVNEIWQLSLPANATLAGGKGGLWRVVEWVTSLRAAFPLFGDMDQGYLALACLELARRVDPYLTIEHLLTELDRAGASALVVDEPISPQDAAVADKLALPVFTLPSAVDLHSVERDVLRALVDREGQLARREMAARQYLRSLFASTGMQGTLDELARLTSGHVVVLDESDNLLAEDSLSVSGPSGDSLSPDDTPATEYPIRVAGRSLGRLILHTLPGQVNPLDIIYAQQVAELCGIEMLQRLTRQETEERLGADLVEQLLDEAQEEEATAHRFLRLGYRLSPDEHHVVIALGPLGEDSQSCQSIAQNLRWAARRDDMPLVIAKYREHTLVFCAFKATISERHIKSWLQETLSLQPGIAGHRQRCSAGIGRTVVAHSGVESISGLRRGVGQALDAWHLGQHIDDRESPYHYEELGLYRFIACLRDRDELNRFYEETLGTLVRYDQAHNTDLVHTLDVFFAENTNASRASRSLHVHRNTLNYRLQRIVEIADLSLDDPEMRLALQVALKIHHLSV